MTVLAGARATRSARFSPLSAVPLTLPIAVALLLVLVPPAGEFPINDDWVYARAVQASVERGWIAVPAYSASPLVLHILWGSLFVQLFGFSHTVLRVSTLVLAAGALLGAYYLFRELLDQRRALLGALLLVFNPLFVSHSYSFMTDVPFLCLAIWAQLCYVRGLRGESPSLAWLTAGSALAAAATLTRQLGLLLPLAAWAGVCLRSGPRCALRPRTLASLAGPFLPTFLILHHFDSQRPTLKEDPLAWTLAFWGEQGAGIAGIMLARLAETALTLGLLALPITIAILASAGRPRWWARPAWPATVAIGAVLLGLGLRSVVLRQGAFLPYASNVLTERGYLGHLNFVSLPEAILIPRWLLQGATAAALLSTVLVALTAGSLGRRENIRPAWTVPIVFGLLALGATVAYRQFFDRYFLILVPAVLLVALAGLPSDRRSHLVVVAGIVLMAVWSVSWQRDLLERRAALWTAGEALVAMGIRPEDIAGGYEWNGWFALSDVLAEAEGRFDADRAGLAMQAFVLDRIYFKRAQWELRFNLPASQGDVEVLSVVPYGHGRRVLAVQRPRI